VPEQPRGAASGPGAIRREDLLAVIRPFASATPLPRAAFVDPAVLEFEERTFFSSAWIPVAHEADIPRPGDWVRAPLRGEHLILVRGSDLTIQALHAVCTHRGTLLCDGDHGRLPALELRCPYHAWVYATDGSLLQTPGASQRAPGLETALVDVLCGVIFVNLDRKAAPLAKSWDGGPPWLAPEKLWALARARRVDNVVAANWKVVVGNFQESHHFPAVHPGLEGKTPWRVSSSIVESDAWLGGVMDISLPHETVSMSGQRSGRPFVAAPEDQRRVLDAFVFPLWLTSLQPDYLLTYRLSPLAVDSTFVVAEIHVHPGALARGVDLDDIFSFWDRTNAEDRAICELQQRGLATRRASTCYAKSEDGLHAFERIVAERYLQFLLAET
jgi:Rieske 2Fe-2S family protein